MNAAAHVREHTDLVALIMAAGVSLTRHGRTWIGRCPFHAQTSPTFHASAARGFFHCFECKASGTAIDFVMRSEGVDFHEAVRRLQERLGDVRDATKGAMTR